MPNLNNRPLADITFIDSLTGYAVTGDNSPADTNFIVKTTDGGEVWSIVSSIYRDLSRVVFLNGETGYISGGYNVSGGFLARTTNSGVNWNHIETPSTLRIDDISVLSEDTMWIVDGNAFFGGLFRTTNGGQNWELQYGGGLGGTKPNRVYFYDGKFGWAGNIDGHFFLRTTNCGTNWVQIPGQIGFRDMYFADSMTGWKTLPMKKTTDGGLTWVNQYTATGGYIVNSGVYEFANINADTIWGIGGYVLFPNNQFRAILHRTTNGGENWHYQVPDTSIRIGQYFHLDFVDRLKGWAYQSFPVGIHTVTGGDPVFLNVRQISTEVPQSFVLHQNYPNPFNPVTVIRFEVQQSGRVRLVVHDITGKMISELLNRELSSGTYEYIFDGEGLPSGVYFYSLMAKGKKFTRKMVIAK
jgi:photosystem II stability/assembly factor-like uncharacterized protein